MRDGIAVAEKLPDTVNCVDALLEAKPSGGIEFFANYRRGTERRFMSKTELKSFGKPDEVREFPKGRLELMKIGGATVGRAVFEPGWRWATSVQPIAKTHSCEAPHFQYHISGVLRVKMDDGTELDCKP